MNAQRTIAGLGKTIKNAAAAYIGFTAIKSVSTVMIENASALEGYRNTLNVVMKDTDKAAKTMMWAIKFANKTPFETGSIVEATVRLQSYGLEAAKILPGIGDMAGVMGKDIMQAAEAVADAQTGELERMKEFGITKNNIIEHGAKKLKLLNLVNNKGQIIDQKNFNKAMFSLMNEKFKGGMALQSKTLKGLVSTVSGIWKTGLATISGISLTGEIVDGSLYYRIKEGADKLGKTLLRFSEDGTFEKIGKNISFAFEVALNSIGLLGTGFEYVWPYIKGTGIIISDFTSVVLENFKKFSPSLSDISKAVKKFKNYFVKSFKNMKLSIQSNLPKLIKFKNSVIDIGNKVKNVLVGGFKLAKPPVEWLINNGLPVVEKAILMVIEQSTKLYENFSTKWTEIEPIVKAIGEGLSKGLVLAFEMARPAVEWMISDGLPEIISFLIKVGEGAFEVASFFVDNWDKIEPLIVGIVAAFVTYKAIMIGTAIVSSAMTVATIATSVATILLTGAVGALGVAVAILTSPITLIVLAVGALVAVGWAVYKNWDEIFTWFSGKFDELIQWVTPIGEKIISTFQLAREGIELAFNGIGEFFTGIWDGVLDVGKGFINGFSTGINHIIGSINNIKVDIPDWVPGYGGESFGFDIPKIQMLEKGGITKGPTLALIGEGREQEAVIPLSKLDRMLKFSSYKAKKFENKPQSISEKIIYLKEKVLNNKTSKQNLNIEYKPVFNFYGDTNKEEVKKVIENGQKDFEKLMDKYLRRKERLAY